MKTTNAVLVILVMAFTNLSCHSRPRYEIIDLGTGSYNESYAEVVNEHGQIIGKLANTDGRYEYAECAFFWDSTNGMLDLGTLGGKNSYASGTNSTGQVIGWADTTNGDTHAFFWDTANGMVDLGTLGGHESRALAINNAGLAVGWSETSSGDRHALRWDSANGMIGLGTPSGRKSYATNINEVGQIVGWYTDHNDIAHAVLWDANSRMIALDIPGDLVENVAINNSGQVIVGCSRITLHDWHAFFWDSTTSELIDLGTLGGRTSRAYAINDAGQIVGYSYKKFPHRRRAFIWNKVNGMVNLGTLSIFNGGPLLDNNSMAFAINDSGQVVGFCGSEFPEFFGSGHAWLWDKTNGMMKLEDLLADKSGWKRLISAEDINNKGQIVGVGETANGKIHAFLMTPVSEPTDR